MQRALLIFPAVNSSESCVGEDMKLRDEDREWLTTEISSQIQDAIDVFQPHGWRRFTALIKEWGGAASVLGVIVALLGMALAASYFAVARVGKEASFETETDSKFVAINHRLDSIDASLDAIQLNQLASATITQKSAYAAQKIVTDARLASLTLPKNVIEETGGKLVEAAKDVPDAWGAALAFVNYSSFRKSESGEAEPEAFNRPTRYHYTVKGLGGSSLPTFSTTGPAPKQSAATINEIGNDLNENLPDGPAEIIGKGGSIVLDNLELKNVTLIGVHVYYKGGPVQLTNVNFVNCIFEMPYTKNAQTFALAQLKTDTSVTLDPLG